MPQGMCVSGRRTKIGAAKSADAINGNATFKIIPARSFAVFRIEIGADRARNARPRRKDKWGDCAHRREGSLCEINNGEKKNVGVVCGICWTKADFGPGKQEKTGG